MSFKTAKEILFILDEAEWKKTPKGRFPRYTVGSALSKIDAIITKQVKAKAGIFTS